MKTISKCASTTDCLFSEFDQTGCNAIIPQHKTVFITPAWMQLVTCIPPLILFHVLPLFIWTALFGGEKKKNIHKVSFYFSVIYSAKILWNFFFITLPLFSLWACGAVCQICGMPVGCSQERHGALIQHKQGHKTTTQPLVQSLLQISPTPCISASHQSNWCYVRRWADNVSRRQRWCQRKKKN